MIYEVLPGEIPTCDMAQKVATERKMKLRQETTSLSQIVTVTEDKKQQAFINTNTRRFKIQTGDMGPSPGRASYITHPL